MKHRVSSVGAVLLLSLAAAMPLVHAQDARDLPDLDDTGMVVPWSDFKVLLQDLRQVPTPVPVPPPPVPFAYSGCVAVAVVDEAQERVRLELSYEVQVLEPEAWVAVPVAPDGAALESAVMDGAAARLFRADGFHRLALRGAGRHRMEVVMLLPVHESRGSRSAGLRFPPVSSVDLRVRLPREDLEVEVAGAVVRSLTRGGGETLMGASLERVGDTELTWFRQLQSDEKSAKTFAEVGTLYQVGEGVARASTTVALTIHGRGVDAFRVAIPDEITILDVSGHGITSWQVATAPEGGSRVLELRLNFQAQGAYSFQVSFEQPLGADGSELLLADIEVLDVLRERGFMAVAAATNVEITPRGELENVAPVDPVELPAELRSRAGESVLYAFKYLRHPVVVELEVRKHGDVPVKRTIVERARVHSFVNREGRRLSSATYQITNNRKQYLALTLPADAVMWGAFRDGEPVKAARRDDGVILVPLKKTSLTAQGRPQSFSVEVVYFEPGNRIRVMGSLDLRAPVVDVDAMELEWVLYLPRDKRYFGFRGDLDEVAAANRIALLGGAAYNLENADDLQLLASFTRNGKRLLSDGANEVEVDKVLIASTGEDRPLAADELGRIAGDGEAVGRSQQAANEPQSLTDRDEARQGQQHLDNLMSQVAMSSNVAFEATAAGATANVAGVLPVHFRIPVDGLRLSFGARLVTDGSEPQLLVRFIPASWRMPQLGRFWVLVLAFLTSLIVGLLVVGGMPGLSRGAWLTVLGSLLVLVAVFLVAEAHRTLFWVGVALAATVCFGVWSMRDRRDTEGF